MLAIEPQTQSTPALPSARSQGKENTESVFLTGVNLPSTREVKEGSGSLVKLPTLKKSQSKPATAMPGKKPIVRDQRVRTSHSVRPREFWKTFAAKRGPAEIRPATRSFLRTAKQEVQSEFEGDTTAAALIKNVKELERSSHIKNQLSMLEANIGKKKRAYNKVHHENEKLLERLEILKHQAEQGQVQESEYITRVTQLRTRNSQFEEINNGIINEQYYDETLKYMLGRRKVAINLCTRPINKLRAEIKMTKREIEENEKYIFRSKMDENKCQKQIGVILRNQELTKNKYHEEREKYRKIYKDKERFYHFFEAEKLKDKEIEAQKCTANRLLSEEKKILQIQEDKMLNAELSMFENYIRERDSHFQRIQKVSTCASPTDMLSYYYYLLETKANLTKSGDQYAEVIESLEQQKQILDEELVQYKFTDGDAETIDPHEFKKMEQKFVEKQRLIDENDKSLKKVEEVVAAAINSVSRLIFQLYTDYEKHEISKANVLLEGSAQSVNAANVEAHLSVCGMKLERFLDVLKEKRIVFYNESINTTKDPERPPAFIKLNQSPRHVRKDSVSEENEEGRKLLDEQNFKDKQRENIHKKQEDKNKRKSHFLNFDN